MANFVQTANRKCRIIRLRRTLRNWCNKARFSSYHHGSPSDVPKGHVAVYVDCGWRFLVHAAYLNHPLFVKLLTEAVEEFGFDHDGPPTIPYEESAFEDVIRIVSGSGQDTGCGKREEFWSLLQGLVQRPNCIDGLIQQWNLGRLIQQWNLGRDSFTYFSQNESWWLNLGSRLEDRWLASSSASSMIWGDPV